MKKEKGEPKPSLVESRKVVGKCSICSGTVTTDSQHKIPTCEACGAVKKDSLETIQMERPFWNKNIHPEKPTPILIPVPMPGRGTGVDPDWDRTQVYC